MDKIKKITIYKGNASSYRKIRDNVGIVSKKYKFVNGYFGVSSESTGSKTRNIFSKNNLETAYDFYDMLAYGGKETELNGNIKRTKMSDGTIIVFRKISTSDKTPVVQINIKNSTDSAEIKEQKIHFMQEVTCDKNRR